jgi:hypothetical protein
MFKFNLNILCNRNEEYNINKSMKELNKWLRDYLLIIVILIIPIKIIFNNVIQHPVLILLDIFYLITTILSLYAGLTIALKLIIPSSYTSNGNIMKIDAKLLFFDLHVCVLSVYMHFISIKYDLSDE